MKKSKTRIFVNNTISSNLLVYIKDKQHHFLKNVIRIKINDALNIFDGKTGEWKAIVLSINRNNTVLRVSKNIYKFKASEDIWLIFAPIKQHRMSLTIQKATELGVTRIIPCITEYTNFKKINLKSFLENAIEASEQSRRLDIPKIEKSIELKSLLLDWPSDRKLFYCDEKLANTKPFNDSMAPFIGKKIKWAIIIGPEGGFSDSENQLIRECKSVVPISLGPRVLRSDTAITVSLFWIQELLNR